MTHLTHLMCFGYFGGIVPVFYMIGTSVMKELNELTEDRSHFCYVLLSELIVQLQLAEVLDHYDKM